MVLHPPYLIPSKSQFEDALHVGTVHNYYVSTIFNDYIQQGILPYTQNYWRD